MFCSLKRNGKYLLAESWKCNFLVTNQFFSMKEGTLKIMWSNPLFTNLDTVAHESEGICLKSKDKSSSEVLLLTPLNCLGPWLRAHRITEVSWKHPILKMPYILLVSVAFLCVFFKKWFYYLCIYCLSFPTRMNIISMKFCLLPYL